VDSVHFDIGVLGVPETQQYIHENVSNSGTTSKIIKTLKSHLLVDRVYHLHNQADFVLRVEENGVHSKMPRRIILMKAVNMVEPCLASVITITDKKI
jgi:hypothetical protein